MFLPGPEPIVLPAAPRHPVLYQINTRVLLAAISARFGASGRIRRHSRRGAAGGGRARLRLGLVPRRLADRRARPLDLAQQPALAGGLPPGAARPAPGRHRRLAIRHLGLQRRGGVRRQRGPGPAAAPGECGRAAADAGLRAEPPGTPTMPGSPGVRSCSCLAPRPISPARPQDWLRLDGPDGESMVLAHGRDPYFPGWVDTVQLDYANPRTQAAMGRGAARHRRPLRRAALRHGDAAAARGVPGRPGATTSPDAPSRTSGKASSRACTRRTRTSA